MTELEARKIIKQFRDRQGNSSDDIEALEKAIKSLELISNLIDRPCLACKWRHHDGCMQFDCPFDEVLNRERNVE